MLERLIQKLGPVYVFFASFVLLLGWLIKNQLQGKIDIDVVLIGNLAVFCALGAALSWIIDKVGYGCCALMDWAEKQGLFDLRCWF